MGGETLSWTAQRGGGRLRENRSLRGIHGEKWLRSTYIGRTHRKAPAVVAVCEYGELRLGEPLNPLAIQNSTAFRNFNPVQCIQPVNRCEVPGTRRMFANGKSVRRCEETSPFRSFVLRQVCCTTNLTCPMPGQASSGGCMNDSIKSNTMLPRRYDEAGGKPRVGRPPGMPDIADGGLVLAILIASRNTNVLEYTWKLCKAVHVGRRRY